MFHKCKSGLNEYWSHKDDLFTVLETLITMDFYHVEALPSSFFFFYLKSQFCGPYVCLYSECGQSIIWLLTSGDSLSLPTSRGKQSKKCISWEMYVYKSQEHVCYPRSGKRCWLK